MAELRLSKGLIAAIVAITFGRGGGGFGEGRSGGGGG